MVLCDPVAVGELDGVSQDAVAPAGIATAVRAVLAVPASSLKEVSTPFSALFICWLEVPVSCSS